MPDFPDEAPIGYEDPSLRPHSSKRKEACDTCSQASTFPVLFTDCAGQARNALHLEMTATIDEIEAFYATAYRSLEV